MIQKWNHSKTNRPPDSVKNFKFLIQNRAKITKI